MRILGIDPGGTTGWAELNVIDNKLVPGFFGMTKDKTLKEIRPNIQNADVIVYEGFWIRPDKAMGGKFNWQEPPALIVIGALLALCAELGKTQVVKQTPAQRVPGYGFAGLSYKKGASGVHDRDALAHAAYYAVKELHARPVVRTK
jgi:hypothetical protein